MEKTYDRRKLVREILDATIELSWTDSDGVKHTALGTARDASSDGFSGVFPTYIATGQLISAEFKPLGLFGHGVVRHSTPVDEDFLIGMAYMGELYSA